MSSRGRTATRQVRRRVGPSRPRSATLRMRSRSVSSVRTAPSRSLSSASRLTRLESMIETKEGCRRITNIQLAHNNLTVFNDADGNVFNPFICSQGASDPMANGGMVRVGDKITVRGIKLKFFVETSLQRSNVYFKFYFVKMAKGETLNRANFFKDACSNKMIDQINTERFTVLASKTVRLTTPNGAPASFNIASGVPQASTIAQAGTRIISMWIPGRLFGRGGNVQYENASTNQLKFFDYRLCAVAYDWYGTPQDINNVGFVNDGYCKTYFKDA